MNQIISGYHKKAEAYRYNGSWTWTCFLDSPSVMMLDLDIHPGNALWTCPCHAGYKKKNLGSWREDRVLTRTVPANSWGD